MANTRKTPPTAAPTVIAVFRLLEDEPSPLPPPVPGSEPEPGRGSEGEPEFGLELALGLECRPEVLEVSVLEAGLALALVLEFEEEGSA